MDRPLNCPPSRLLSNALPAPPAKKLALCRTAPVTGPSGPQATPAQPEAVEVEAERRQRRQRVAEKLRCGMDVLQAVPGMERTLLLPEPELPPEVCVGGWLGVSVHELVCVC